MRSAGLNLLKSGYRIEFTSCGHMTLATENEGNHFYFHTNNRVRAEAFSLARSWHRNEAKNYIIYGFGMGYHLDELLSISEDIVIDVYEADLHVIQLACAFANVKTLLESRRLQITYDPNFTGLKERISLMQPDERFYIHYPSYKNIRNEEGRRLLNKVFPWSKVLEDS